MAVTMLSGCAFIAENQAARLEAKKNRASAQAQENKQIQKNLLSVPICESAEDCAAKWEAAQLWIVKNAGYKLQIVTDVLLETYGSRDMSLAVRVTKEPIGGGKYKLVATIGCNNPFGCTTNPKKALSDFNLKVSWAK